MKQETEKDIDLTGVAFAFIIGVMICFFVTGRSTLSNRRRAFWQRVLFSLYLVVLWLLLLCSLIC